MNRGKKVQRSTKERVKTPTRQISSGLSLDTVKKPSPSRARLELTRQLGSTGESRDGALLPDCESTYSGDKKCLGIRYITEDLIKKISKQDNLASVWTLNLSGSKDDKQIKYFENLERCERLQVLNLSHNCIEKIEKLERLHKMRELRLSDNKICKIEGLEHMANLQILNLSHNDIEHVPVWMAKKLRSLRTLNLQNNRIFSLHEVAKLKALKNLSELVLAENPVANLPHYRLFLIFHLRSLDTLDGQSVDKKERELAHERFHIEEVERLEQEVEAQLEEMGVLRGEQAVALEGLEKQLEVNRSLQIQNKQQQQSQHQLERELETKSELLKQKTMELTRACHKHYELEQELAFHKIDAKFEPLPFFPEQAVEMEVEASPMESPYIGKARHRRNLVGPERVGAGEEGHPTVGLSETDSPGQDAIGQAQAQAEQRLQQLHSEIERAEQQILRASEELQQLEEGVAQKRILEAEKEQLRQHLQLKLRELGELRKEAEEVERQLDRQGVEMSQTQDELEQLQNLLDSLDPTDPRHAHVKAQMPSKSQLLGIMSKKYRELESRLDEILNRIAKETEEIKDLEQQLTEGQIAANEALKRDLEGIIAGLQEYLHGVRDQARHSQAQCRRLQREKEALQRLLDETEQQRNQLETEAHSVSNKHEEALQQQLQELDDLRTEMEELRQGQGQIGAYGAELEAQLRQKDTEAMQLSEELGRLRRLSQMEHSALQAELQNERQAKENALAQVQLAAERELERAELLEQVHSLQEEGSALREQRDSIQAELEQARAQLLSPSQVAQRVDALTDSIAAGQQERRLAGATDPVGASLAGLQQEVWRLLSAGQKDRDGAQRLRREVASLRDRLHTYQDKYRDASQQLDQAREAERRDDEAELQGLREELQEAQQQQYLMLQRLQEAESERDRLLSELQHQDREMRAEEGRTQEQLQCLGLQLQDLRRSFTTADEMASQQLSVAREQLRSLHRTVLDVQRERAEDAEELEGTRLQATQAVQDLSKAEAEINALQRLLQDRVHVMDRNSPSAPDASTQRRELERLSQALRRQQAQTRRLRDQLARAKEGNTGDVEELLGEIEALRDTLLQQNHYLSSYMDPQRNRGYWYYVPPPVQNAPSLVSQGTQDSGLGSQYPPSPERGRRSSQRGRRERAPPAHPGHWVYAPHTRVAHTHPDRVQESHEDSDVIGCGSTPLFTPPPGYVIYTTPPPGYIPPPGTVVYAPPVAGLSVAPGTVIYGAPPEGAGLVFGPPPNGMCLPLAPSSGVLHCNVPEHQDMGRGLRAVQRPLQEHQHGEAEGVGGLHTLREQRAELQQELRQLRRSVSRLQRRRESLESSGVMAEDARCVLAEVECVEQTLLKRRAELREADRRLLQAETRLKDTRSKAKDVQQRQAEVQRRVGETTGELEEIEQQTQDSATQLVLVKQQLRDLQGQVEELQKQRLEKEHTVQAVEEVLASRDADFQEVNRKLERATERLEASQKELRDTQALEVRLLQSCRDSEETLNQRKEELEQLDTKVAVQQEELALLDRKLRQWREEECVLQASVEQHRHNLVEVLRKGEDDAQLLHRRIEEMRGDLQNLSVQRGELDSQLSERRSRLSHYKHEEEREEEVLQNLRSTINKQKAELKHVLEMVELESGELQGLQVQHDQKLDQLEKSQETLLQVRVALQELQQESQQQRSEVERQRRLLEQERGVVQERGEEVHTLKEEVAAARRERSTLEEQCKNLEARRVHADRCLVMAEESSRNAQAVMSRLQSELDKLKQEHKQAQDLQQDLQRDTAATQRQIQEESGELNRLREQVAHSQQHLERIGETRALARELEELQRQQQEQRADLQVAEERLQRRQHRAERLEQRLRERDTELAEKHSQLQQLEENVRVQQRQSSEMEELQKLQAQRQALQGSAAQRAERVGRLAAPAVWRGEENGSLQEQRAQLQERVATLEEEVSERSRQLQERSQEAQALQEELDDRRREVQRLQEALLTERRSAEESMEALRSRSRADREKLQGTEKDRARLQRELLTVEQAAQENHQRARALQRELSTVSKELGCLKDKLRSQEEGETRLRDIEETVRSLKWEVKAELDNGMKDLEFPPSVSSDDTDQLKENFPFITLPVARPAYNTKDEQWRGDILRERLRQQEDHLKAQLRRRMFSQQEALCARRQQTEGSLQGLRHHVDRLDQLLGKSTSSDSPCPSDAEPPIKQGCADLSASWMPSGSASQTASPVRLDPSVPEKDLAH